MEYYSALKKEGNPDPAYNMDGPWKHYAKWNKPNTKGQVLYDIAYVRYLEQSNSQRKKVWYDE